MEHYCSYESLEALVAARIAISNATAPSVLAIKMIIAWWFGFLLEKT